MRFSVAISVRMQLADQEPGISCTRSHVFQAHVPPQKPTIFVSPGAPVVAAPVLDESSFGGALTKVSNLSCNPDVGVESLDSITSIFHGRLRSNSISRPCHCPSPTPSCDLRQTKTGTKWSVVHRRVLLNAPRKPNGRARSRCNYELQRNKKIDKLYYARHRVDLALCLALL